jgi:hypothetical protein
MSPKLAATENRKMLLLHTMPVLYHADENRDAKTSKFSSPFFGRVFPWGRASVRGLKKMLLKSVATENRKMLLLHTIHVRYHADENRDEKTSDFSSLFSAASFHGESKRRRGTDDVFDNEQSSLNEEGRSGPW